MLEEDAPEDTDTAKAVVETLSLLCEIDEVDGRVRIVLPCSPRMHVELL